MVSLCFLVPVVLQVLSRIVGALADSDVITLDYGSFRGFNSTQYTESFLGIPFAEPPVGSLRFNNPVAPKPFTGVRNATWFGDACPQQPLLSPGEQLPNNTGLKGVTTYLSTLLPRSAVANASEDCLYLNVVRPSNISSNASLPVIVWIYGGAFEYSDASSYNGTHIVSRSIALNSPVIFVSFNYRSNAFGFLGGKEIKAAGLGNFGLYDQRLALTWVRKYIARFGGDPSKVIASGESAGSISVMLQMVTNDGNLGGLFRGAVMLSGSVPTMHDITYQHAQDNYDFLVQQTNCTTANSTLDCLRKVPYEAIVAAVQETPSVLSYQALNTSWKPLIDGVFLKQSVRQSLSEGKYTQIPAILGSVDDEGTLFSLYSLNVTTNAQFDEYIRTNFLVGATDDDIQQLDKFYPDNSTSGSPYNVGTNDTLTPEYKHISSFQGDFYIQSPRRFSLNQLSRTQDAWGYLWKRGKFIPGIGSFHASDLQMYYNMTGTTDWLGADALVNFAYNLDPNAPKDVCSSGSVSSKLTNVTWPRYNSSTSPQLLTLLDPDVLDVANDTFRSEGIAFLDEMHQKLGL